MKIVFFYQNIKKINSLIKNVYPNSAKYKLNELNKLKDIDTDFIIIEADTSNIKSVINKLDSISDIPYLIITDKIINDNGLYLIKIITYQNINKIKDIIENYFRKKRNNNYSIFEITNVMQIISMEKKTISLKIISENKMGIIFFKNGLPLYSKTIINKKAQYGLKSAFNIISWDNIKFRVVRVFRNFPQNLKTDLPNLLIGAMQYKDEFKLSKNLESSKSFNCKNITDNFDKILGYIGIVIYKNGKEVCISDLSNSKIKDKGLKSHVDRIILLVKIMLNDMGFTKFESLLLSTKNDTVLIQHNDKNNITVVLFLQEDSNIPLSKVIVKKIMADLI